MKTLLFCSFLLAFLSFACKPKPLDNLKEVAKQAEENKVFRVSRERLALEAQRVADSVLTGVLVSAREKVNTGEVKSDLQCSFTSYPAYLRFQEKYRGKLYVVFEAAGVQRLKSEMEELRKYRQQLPFNKAGLPATFQTLTDTILYVREIEANQKICEQSPASGYWVFRFPKQRFVEVLTIKVKPKPKKGPNW